LVIYSVVVDDAKSVCTGAQVVGWVEVDILALHWVLTNLAVEHIA
jgi:hypothetical protein